jgi:hypothetical protein
LPSRAADAGRAAGARTDPSRTALAGTADAVRVVEDATRGADQVTTVACAHGHRAAGLVALVLAVALFAGADDSVTAYPVSGGPSAGRCSGVWRSSAVVRKTSGVVSATGADCPLSIRLAELGAVDTGPALAPLARLADAGSLTSIVVGAIAGITAAREAGDDEIRGYG